MDECNSPNSFYGQQIYGDQFPEELSALPAFDPAVQRTNLVSIDPVVRNLSSKPNQSASQVNGYRERYLEHSTRDNRYPNNHSISSARSMGNISSSYKLTQPGETPNSEKYNLKDYRQNLSHSGDRRTRGWDQPPIGSNERTTFYSFQDGLNLTTQIQNDEYEEERALESIHPRPKPPPRLTEPEFLNHRPHRPSKLRQTPEPTRQPSYEMIPNRPAGTPRQMRPASEQESKRKNNQYRTVLYVVPSPPAQDGDPNKSSPLHSDRSGSRESYHCGYPEVNLNYNSEDGPQTTVPAVNKSPIPQYYTSRLAGDVAVPVEYDMQSPYGMKRYDLDINQPKESSRYDVDDKPHYQTLPSPRQMAVTMPTNGYNTTPLRNIDPIVQPTTVRLARSDYNQVVVDIKPRQLNEADKQQHVSQWIQVGTLGDTVNSQADEQSGSIMEEEEKSDVVQSLPYDDLVDQDISNQMEPHLHFNSASRKPELCQLPTNQCEGKLENNYPADLWTPPIGRISPGKNTTKPEMDIRRTPDRMFPSNSVTSKTAINMFDQSNVNLATKLHESRPVEPPVIPLSPQRTRSPVHQSPTITIIPNNVNSLPFESRRNLRKGRSKTIPNNRIIDTPTISRIMSNGCYRPQVAPKPTSDEQLAAFRDRRTLTTTGAEIRHLNSKVSSRLSQANLVSRTFPPFTKSHSQAYLSSSKLKNGENPYYLESTRDTPVPNVRNLTAYFSELIERQNDTNGSVNSVRYGECVSASPQGTNEPHGLYVGNQAPFLLYHESEEERLRRLRAVDNLRYRTALPTTDYRRPQPRPHITNGTFSEPEELYHYNGPSHTQKFNDQYIANHFVRGSTPLSDGL
ncbi:hypothetical protein FBUS_04433 [Fasciolopsis buskii]|uniref:Uncharacterized protein n=1 Tax=Fasciolopsis buskii TaxID=27845 RepID=A0A8E0RRU7_9TREM|nr:hypothetical protein FBUS_04433 [Fasciolopsis buski]